MLKYKKNNNNKHHNIEIIDTIYKSRFTYIGYIGWYEIWKKN